MELEPMKQYVKILAKAAAEAANDRDGTASMKLSQAAVSLTNAMMNFRTLNLIDDDSQNNVD